MTIIVAVFMTFDVMFLQENGWIWQQASVLGTDCRAIADLSLTSAPLFRTGLEFTADIIVTVTSADI
jgi:hypothetical protein